MLSVRSDYSVSESILKIKDVVAEAQRVGAKAVALTDTVAVTGIVDFSGACKKAGVKPIIGARIRLVDNIAWRKPPKKEGKQKAPPEYFVTWYVLREPGLKALYRLLSLANDDAHFYNNAKVSFDELIAALDSVTAGDVAIAFTSAYSVVAHPEAARIAGSIKASVSASNAFLELCPINTPYFDTMNKKAIALATQLGLPTLVSRPALYKPGQAAYAEILGAVYKNNKLSDPWHNSPHSSDLHAMTDKELMAEAVATANRLADQRGMKGVGVGGFFLRGMQNTDRLVEAVEYVWTKQAPSLPVMAPDEFAEVKKKCLEGWARRFSGPVFAHRPSAEELDKVYKPRLVYELGVLKKLNFSGYFLLTEDVVNYAKNSGIRVGPGRGSAAGSLVAYLLGITDCDPIRFGLLFERFINPDRIDLPDADLDFMASRREEVFAYIVAKYGANRAAGVSNFNKIGPASAIKDVSKAFGVEAGHISKLAPKKHGANVSLSEAIDQVPEFAKFRDEYTPIWESCLALEGVNRTLGQHAAGMVVAGVDLVERAVIERRKGDSRVVCFDKRQVEEQGLVKLDVLGLETLDIIDHAMRYIRERHSKRVNLMAIPLDDAETLANFARGNSTAIFQFDGGGMKALLRSLGTTGTLTFDDITAATALYRPGPMESGMMESFAKRKQGLEAVIYDHELLEPILGETYGVITYQEQTMQIARVLAGYTAPDADKLRKIIGKKLPEEMKKERGKFVTGCMATIEATEEWAGALFDKIEGFAGYGFNKSHATCYALVSYQSMYLKTQFPVEFFAACLTLMGDDKLPALVGDATANYGLQIEMPEINLATDRFEIITDKKLMIPFHRIKGLSDTAAKAIVEARKDPTTGAHKPFTSQADFVARVNKRLVNVAKQAALEKVGSFAAIEPKHLPIDSPTRIKDQKELIPSLVTALVPVSRTMEIDEGQERELEKAYALMLASPEIVADGVPVRPYIGEDAQFAILFDAPSAQEESENMMFMSKGYRRPFAAEQVQKAMDVAGVSVGLSYWSALIKRPKSGKQLSAEEISLYRPHLARELGIVKPPVIVLMGTSTVREFVKDFKGRASDEAGKVIYDAGLDANLVIGFGPGELFHQPSKFDNLVAVFEKVKELIS